jgi:hypothetical protein
MTLVFSLANRTSYEHLVRPARSTASRKAWMRLIRTHLDTIVLADGVVGITLRVEAVTGEVERQGDIFDRGFATARATEETVAQLLDDQGAVIVVPSNTRHPLLERRTTWLSQEPAHAARTHLVRESPAEPKFTLQLLQQPRPISVKTAKRRDHDLPIKYRDTDGWVMIESAAVPIVSREVAGTILMSGNTSAASRRTERWCGFSGRRLSRARLCPAAVSGSCRDGGTDNALA